MLRLEERIDHLVKKLIAFCGLISHILIFHSQSCLIVGHNLWLNHNLLKVTLEYDSLAKTSIKDEQAHRR